MLGTQSWTKESIGVTKYIDLAAIPLDTTDGSNRYYIIWQNLTIGAYTMYENEASSGTNAIIYGCLHHWYAAKGFSTVGSVTCKNLCPASWHVPSVGGWSSLSDYLDGLNIAGVNIKAKSTTLWIAQSTGTRDSSGLTTLSGAFRSSIGSSLINTYSFFGSASEYSIISTTYKVYMTTGDAIFYSGVKNKSVDFSALCLMD